MLGYRKNNLQYRAVGGRGPSDLKKGFPLEKRGYFPNVTVLDVGKLVDLEGGRLYKSSCS